MRESFVQEGYDATAYEAAILAYLKQQQKGVTVHDVVVGTGLNTEWTAYTLRQLLGKFPAHLEINEKQELLYLFDFTPKPVPVGKYLLQAVYWSAWAVWQVFVLGFKVWIVGMLMTYTLAYAIILMVAIGIALRSEAVFEMLFKGIWYGLGELWGMLTGKSRAQIQESDKHLLSDIFSYVFGATPPKADKRATEKLILQEIRAQGGKIMPSDIVRLTGWQLMDAQTQAAYLLANYQGEALVTPEGKIEYIFPDLAKEEEAQSPPAIWAQDLPLPAMNNMDSSMHNIITGTNIFNIVMSIASPFIFLWLFDTNNLPDWALLVFTAIPLLFSTIFFLVPMARYPFVQFQKRRAQRIQRRYKILGKIYEQLPKPINLKDYAQTFAYAAQTTPEEATEIFEKLQAEMRAETTATADGVLYDFKELA